MQLSAASFRGSLTKRFQIQIRGLCLIGGLLASFLALRPPVVEACHGTPPPPMCGVTGVLIKTAPLVFVVPPGPTTIAIPVTVITTCTPPGCATLGVSTVTIALVPAGGGAPVATGTATFTPAGCAGNGSVTTFTVPVTVPAGTLGLFVVAGTATIPTTAPNLPPGSVTTLTGDTFISFVEEAPGQPGVPRLNLKLISPDPSNPFIFAGPGSQVNAVYRLTNNDPSESVTLTLTAKSRQAARLPGGNPAVYSIASPVSGDDFPIAFDAPSCSIPLPADPATYVQPDITDTITLGPGESEDVIVSSRSFPKCPTGSCSEQALLAEGTFSDGDPVEACASTAHVVQVGLPNTCCGVADVGCPHCNVAGPFTDPSGVKYIDVTMQDTGSGLGFIVPLEQFNMTLSNPGLMYGTTSPVTIRGTKVDPLIKSSLQMLVVDACGNKMFCDPILTDVLRPNGRPAVQTHSGIPWQEHIVTIINGAPGITRLEVEVNGQSYKIHSMKDGEEVTLDVAASMLPGNGNVMTFRATGKPGGSATVMIWEGNNP